METSQQGGWTVTTPFYAGSAADVASATACPHKEYAQVGPGTENDGVLLIQEKCQACVAVRMKYRPSDVSE